MKKLKITAAALCALTLTACVNTAEPVNVQPASSVAQSGSSPSDAQSSSAQSAELSSADTPRRDIENACKSYGLYCVESGDMLVDGNTELRIAPASVTKLMTASVALRYMGADEIITVGTELELVNFNSSLCYIQEGQQLRMFDLLTGLLLPSGNDAAYTVAVNVARKVSGNSDMSDTDAVRYFCGLMNDLAEELGMDGTNFADPDGWDDDAHYTTVSDLMKLGAYALSVPEIREIVSTPEKYVEFYSGENATWINGNKLLHEESRYYCPNAIGLKTGATDNAGLCLMAAFVKNGKTYITATMGCETDEVRYNLTLDMYRTAG